MEIVFLYTKFKGGMKDEEVFFCIYGVLLAYLYGDNFVYFLR